MYQRWKRLSWQGKISFIWLLLVALSSITYVALDLDLHRQASNEALLAPSREHILGTDQLGIDMLAKMVFGASISLFVGISVGMIAGVGGSILGMWAGYRGGFIDRLIMSISDIVLCVPNMILVIVVSVFLDSNIIYIILTISILSWVGPARISRSKMLSMRNEKYITAARSYGANFVHLLKKHFLVVLYPLVCMSFIRMVSHGVTMEASLAFLGIGDPTISSWGSMINQAIKFPGIYFTDYWKWLVVPPVLGFILLILSISFIGRDLEKAFNEKLTSR